MKSYSSRSLAVLLLISLGVLSLALLSADAFAPPAGGAVQGSISTWDIPEQFTLTGIDTDVNVDSAVPVDLAAYAGQYTIEAGGSYRLTGELQGSILIDAEEQIVHLILDGVSIRSSAGPALRVRSAGKLVVTVMGQNTLADSGNYFGFVEENACLYSESDVTLNGTGTLDINGDHKDGIHSKDTVKLLGGRVRIWAKRDGIRGNDGICVCGDGLEIECEGSGLHTTKSKNGEKEKGTIEVRGGDVSIIAGEYALCAAKDVYLSGCSLYVKGVRGDCSAQNVYAEEGCLRNG